MVVRADSASDSSLLARAPETGSPLSGERNNMAPSTRAVGSLHLAAQREPTGLPERVLNTISFFFVINNFYFYFFSHTTQQNIQNKNKTKQQTHTQHLKVQSKGRERGKDNKNTKVTPLNNYVHSTKNTAKPQWLKAWPHRLVPLHIHMRQFAGGYGSNMPLYTCVV